MHHESVHQAPALRQEAEPAVPDPAQRTIEKAFAKKLSKAGWHTYRDEETGRVVTNAYRDERMKLSAIAGMTLEVVKGGASIEDCAKIGPCLSNGDRSSQRTDPNRS